MDEKEARRAGEHLAAIARATAEVKSQRVEIIGPAPAPLERLRGRYRFRILARAVERPPLRVVLHHVAMAIGDLSSRVRAVVDVDPVAML